MAQSPSAPDLPGVSETSLPWQTRRLLASSPLLDCGECSDYASTASHPLTPDDRQGTGTAECQQAADASPVTRFRSGVGNQVQAAGCQMNTLE